MHTNGRHPRAIAVTRDSEAPDMRRVPVVMVWLALATALLCALMPVPHAPVSGSAGSAFNPANTLVSLHAPASTRAVIKRLAQGDGAPPLGAGHDGLAGIAPASFAPPQVAVQTPFHLSPSASILSAAPKSAAYPRGPPQA